MRGLRSLLGRWNAPRASRWLLVTAGVLLVGWLQAHLLMAALHDDGGTLRNAIAVYNSGEAREQVAGAVDWAFETGGRLSGASAELLPIQTAADRVLASGEMPPVVAEALVSTVLSVRDDALEQFATDAPARPLSIRLAPVLAAFGIPVPPDLAVAMGLDPTAELAMPIADAQAVETLRTRYHWSELLDRWGLLAAAVLAAAGVVLSTRPLRTLAIALTGGGVLCLLAIPLFGVINGWLLGGGIGPWSALVAPLVESAIAEVRPWLLPIGIAAIVAGAAAGIGWFVLDRRSQGGGRRAAEASGVAPVVDAPVYPVPPSR